MSILSDLRARSHNPGVHRASRGTGMWPFVRPRPWNVESAPGEAVLIDPVAVASEAALELRAVGWPGVALMDQGYQMFLLQAPAGTVAAHVEQWFRDHTQEVCDNLERRLADYDVGGLSKTAKAAMSEAIAAYRSGRYLSVVRVLLPEFECFARALVTDKTKKVSQKKVIADLKAILGNTPLIEDDPLEAFSLFHFIGDHLFAQLFTEADPHTFGTLPDRHAEMHGFASYGTLQGATTLVCIMDCLLRMMARLKRLGAI